MSVSRLARSRVRGARCVRPLLARLRRATAGDARRRQVSPGSRIRATSAIASSACALRKARAPLAAIGLTNDKIALSARRLERAREALEAAAQRAAGRCASRSARRRLREPRSGHFQVGAPRRCALRLLARLIAAFGGQPEPVRLAKLESLLGRAWRAGVSRPRRLAAPSLAPRGRELRVLREPGRAGAARDRCWRPAKSRCGTAAFVSRPLRELRAGDRGARSARSGFAQLRRQLERGPSCLRRAPRRRCPPSGRGHPAGRPAAGDLAGPAAAWTSKAVLCSAEFLW